MFGANKTARPI